MLGQWLDLMISEVFSNLNDSVILRAVSVNVYYRMPHLDALKGEDFLQG